MLALQGDYKIVGDAGDLASAVDPAADLRPDVIVADLRLPDCFGSEVVERILLVQNGARVAALTDVVNEDIVATTVEAVLQGFLLKCRQSEVLVDAIEAVAKGGAVLDPTAVPIVWRRFRQLVRGDHSAQSARLTECKQEVLHLLVTGRST